jgi:two-component system, NtrC family, response regulator
LNEYHIHIPPLRRRPKDILPLAYHFLRLHSIKNNKKINSISNTLADFLQQYTFPGNVRELEHIISSAVLAERSDVLGLTSVQKPMGSTAAAKHVDRSAFPPLAEIQKQHIEKALELTKGNRTQAAQLLGIGLRTLQRKLKLISS